MFRVAVYLFVNLSIDVKLAYSNDAIAFAVEAAAAVFVDVRQGLVYGSVRDCLKSDHARHFSFVRNLVFRTSGQNQTE